ncbi:MAG TPA: phospholipase D-like domain-containing protein [Thermoanaerobaculia bacterium]|nr:phospholipase D-like domain-containing protein [Thermoanaerobaculia bacterium]
MERGFQGSTLWRNRLLACGAAVALLGQACTLISADKRSVYQYKDPSAVADGAFRRSLDAFGTTMVGGNRAEILNNGDEIFPAMTRAIRDARRTVNLESYIFKNDKAGGIVADALIEAARRGVEVRVLVDATGSSHSWAVLDRMKEAGAVRTKLLRAKCRQDGTNPVAGPIRSSSLPWSTGRRTLSVRSAMEVGFNSEVGRFGSPKPLTATP